VNANGDSLRRDVEGTPSTSAATRRPRVVIIGGGFGGVFAAKRLRKADADVTLLDRGTSNLFQPLLYQCATGLLSEGQITVPLRTMLRRYRNTRVLLGEAIDIDAGARTITAARPDGTSFQIGYDRLIVAVGMRQSYFGHDSFAKYAPGMKTLDDALAVRRRIYGAFEIAETFPSAEQRAEWLTFAVVGAGPTGVELAGQIRELATRTIASEFRTINPREARVLLFDGVDAPLASFGPELAAKAASRLEALGVELNMGVIVTDVDAYGLVAKAKDGTQTRHTVRTVLWTAGVQAVDFVRVLAAELGVEQDRSGRIAVKPDLTVPGHDNIWIVGDIMKLNDLPGVAEVALQGGLHAGGQIRRQLAGTPRNPEAFRYHDVGSAAYLYRFHALLKVGPLKLSGFLGWVMWGLIHITFLAGARNRAGVSLTWLLALARGKRRERAIPYGDPSVPPSPYASRASRKSA
jgi:NADH:quinone reductase (non-electrogenic)